MATVTRVDLAEAVREEAGLRKRDAAELVDMLVEAICARLAERGDHDVASLRSSASPCWTRGRRRPWPAPARPRVSGLGASPLTGGVPAATP